MKFLIFFVFSINCFSIVNSLRRCLQGGLKNLTQYQNVKTLTYANRTSESAMDNYLALRNSINLGDEADIVRFVGNSNDAFWVADLSRSSLGQFGERSLADQMAMNYWQYLGGVYRRRLMGEITESDVDEYIQSSHQMARRTIAFFHTDRTSPVNMKNPLQFATKIRGGVNLVFSHAPYEKLPSEKATGITLPRRSGKKIVEITRLTSANGRDSSSLRLMNAIWQLLKDDPSVGKIYMYTSKKHLRLYKRLGVTFDDVIEVPGKDGNNDVIVSITGFQS